MEAPSLVCAVTERRRRLFESSEWTGLDYLEVSDDQRSLCVHFIGRIPDNVTTRNLRIEGGRRIRGVRVVSVEVERSEDPELDDCLRINLDKAGDFSTYRLCLVRSDDEVEAREHDSEPRPFPGVDPRYACLDFGFKRGCRSDLDCNVDAPCPAAPRATPEIDYLAKDYASFCRLMYDRLALLAPGWTERHAPDLGVTLVELLAYAADYASYFQDAVATEAYLDTARLRTSVRRHARLVDYHMHEGCAARAWVTVSTDTDLVPLAAKDFCFITAVPELIAGGRRVIAQTDLEGGSSEAYEAFEPLFFDDRGTITFRAAHSEIAIYTWGDEECCLPRGARRATLLDDQKAPLSLSVGDVLVFEEVLSPTTGSAADADPSHRHAVRLTAVTPNTDALLDARVVEVEWGEEDALPFSLCLSARLAAPDCRRVGGVSVARGNVVLVEHGRVTSQPFGPVDFTETAGECRCDGSSIEVTRRPRRITRRLEQAPLAFGEPVTPNASAAVLTALDPRRAKARLQVTEDAADASATTGPVWDPRVDLLDSGSEDRHFAIETDDEGRATLRFGDGQFGREQDAGSRLVATYRVGGGTAGNVGRDAIAHMVTRGLRLGAGRVEPRNPLAAAGGQAPEPTAEVKLVAPRAFRSRLARAIIPSDYAALAERDSGVQRAAAELRWTGSWYEARVAVDSLHDEQAPPGLTDAIASSLFRYRRVGHDLRVVPARLVPLEVALEICVLPHHTRGHVKADVLAVLGTAVLGDGRLGFFHPDNLTFGEDVRASRLIAAVMGVSGVETVRLTVFKRLGAPAAGELEAGFLPLAASEVAQLDADPDFPENGRLTLTLRGGR